MREPRSGPPRLTSMTKRPCISLVALAVLVGACGQGSPPDARENSSLVASSPKKSSGAESGSRCRGTATESVDREPRKVRIEVMPCRVASGDTPRLVLENFGNTTVGYAPDFKLEEKIPGGWRWINRRQAFTQPLFYLEPGERSDPQPIAVYFSKPKPIKLNPGVYRVSKGIDLTPGRPRPPTMAVSTRFRVIPSS
jgi:hypothetical protein